MTLILTVFFTLFTNNTLAASQTPSDDDSTPTAVSPALPDSYDWPIQSNEIEGWPLGPQVQAETAIIMEASSGGILYGKNIDEVRYPASITKVLTTLVALEHSSMDEKVTFSENAIWGIDRDSTQIGIKIGETLTMEQCFYGIMLASANEVAYAVAEHVGGSMDGFVEMMNTKAKELGCTNTHFVNSHGLHDDNHYTTAHDMALISRAALNNESFRKITDTDHYVIPATNLTAEERWLDNHQKMLRNTKYHYDGCIGGKTGYTSMAGNTLVTYADRNDIELICVVLKDHGAAAYSDTAALLDYGYTNFQKVTLDTAKRITSNKILSFDQQFIQGRPQEDIAILPKDTNAMIPITADLQDLEKKSTVQKYCKKTDYYYHDQLVATSSLLLPKVLPSPPMLNVNIKTSDAASEAVFQKGLNAFQQLPNWKYPLIGLILIAIVFYIVTLITHFKRKRKRKRKKRRR